MNPNVRKANETQSDFRIRRKEERKLEKQYAKGTLLWDSQRKGTYIHKEHGLL